MTMTKGEAGQSGRRLPRRHRTRRQPRRSHVPADGTARRRGRRAGAQGHAPRGARRGSAPASAPTRSWRRSSARAPTSLFSYPGGVILPLYDVLGDYPEIRHILVRHEQGGAHAADGYARASGRVGVCMGTSGPGATNLVTGIATAQLDSVPMVAITGNVPGALIGKDAFQEIDITGITLPMTKHNYLVRERRRHPARRRRGLLHRRAPAARARSTSTSPRTPCSRRRAPSTPPSTTSSPACRASAPTSTAIRKQLKLGGAGDRRRPSGR